MFGDIKVVHLEKGGVIIAIRDREKQCDEKITDKVPYVTCHLKKDEIKLLLKELEKGGNGV